jgi:hypothetical protein
MSEAPLFRLHPELSAQLLWGAAMGSPWAQARLNAIMGGTREDPYPVAKRITTRSIEVAGPLITLGDLRWAIEQCDGASDSSRVEVFDRREMKPIDGQHERIVIHAKTEPTSA